MAGINKVILVGNLGTDPEVRTLESGVKVARINVATSESYTNREGQRVENTEWHQVTLWRQLAEIAEKYLIKGKQVYIEGKIRTRKWKDQEGNDRYTTEITGDTMQILGRVGDVENRTGSQESPHPSSPESKPETMTNNGGDDLPF